MRFEKKRFGARVVNKKKKETVKFCEIEQNGKTRLIPESRPRHGREVGKGDRMKATFKPCPFCGSTSLKVESKHNGQ